MLDISAKWRLKGIVKSLNRKKINIQDRLGREFIFQLVPLREEDFPEGWARQEFQNIYKEMTNEKPIGNEGSVMATVKKMTDEKALEIKQRIKNLAEFCGALKN